MGLSKATLTMILLLLVSLLFCKPSYGALRPGRQFLQDLQAARRDNEQLQRNVALLQRAMVPFGTNGTSTTAEAPDYQCPKLDDTKQNDMDLQSLTSARKGGPLAKALRRMSSTLTLPALQTKLQRSSTERAKFSQAVDSFNVKAVIDILTETASHFAALAAQTRSGASTRVVLSLSNQSSTTKVNTTTALAADASKLMESLSSTSANALHAIATTLQGFTTSDDKKATVGLVTLSLVSVLKFLDQVSLGIASLMVDYLKVLSSTLKSSNKLQVQVVRKALSKRGVFATIVEFLAKQNDMSGLKDALSAIVATDLVTLDHRLEHFTTKANAAALERHSRITNETLAETTGVMIAIMGTAYNGFVHIVVDVLLNDLPTVFHAGYGMMLSSTVRMNQKMASTFNSIFDLVITVVPTDQKTAASGDNAVVSADLVFFIGIVICRILNQRCEGGWQILRLFFYIIALLPIWLPLAIIVTIIFGPNDDEEEDDGCCFGPGLPFPFAPIDVLQRQNDALSSVLPSI